MTLQDLQYFMLNYIEDPECGDEIWDQLWAEYHYGGINFGRKEFEL